MMCALTSPVLTVLPPESIAYMYLRFDRRASLRVYRERERAEMVGPVNAVSMRSLWGEKTFLAAIISFSTYAFTLLFTVNYWLPVRLRQVDTFLKRCCCRLEVHVQYEVDVNHKCSQISRLYLPHIQCGKWRVGNHLYRPVQKSHMSITNPVWQGKRKKNTFAALSEEQRTDVNIGCIATYQTCTRMLCMWYSAPIYFNQATMLFE